MEEALARKKIIDLSHEVYVAADSSKFGKNVTVNITGLDNVNYIVTDKKVEESFIKQFSEAETELMIAGE